MEFGDGYSCGICTGFYGYRASLLSGLSLSGVLLSKTGKRSEKLKCGAYLCLSFRTKFKLFGKGTLGAGVCKG